MVEEKTKAIVTLAHCTEQFFNRNSAKYYIDDPDSGEVYTFFPYALKRTDIAGEYEIVDLNDTPAKLKEYIKSLIP